MTDQRAKIEAYENADSHFVVAQGALTRSTRELGGFVSAASAQRRSQFAEGEWDCDQQYD